MLEGTSDQVLLAGMSARIRRQKTRDVDRPAVIVLLDSDTAGNQTVKSFKKGRTANPSSTRSSSCN